MKSRWIQLVASVVAMIMIANLQYAWTLFVNPMRAGMHWNLTQVQWAFTLFIAFETWVMPFTGWLIDLIGPRAFISLGGLLCGMGWAGMGRATTLTELYVLYSLTGFGAALVYCGSMGTALKWFPDRRGLAAGTIAAGFGSGAALFVPFIASLVNKGDYRSAFLITGIGQGLVIILAAQFLRSPGPGVVLPAPRKVVNSLVGHKHGANFNSAEMLRTPHFYMMFAMALMMGIGGLMATAQVAPMAKTLKMSAATLTLALTINPLANGGARLFWGWVSDHVGRENTMVVAFLLQAVALLGVVMVGGSSPAMFVLTLALVYFTWGEIYSLFPSASADYFGSRFASSNYAFIYAAKGAASIVGGGLAATLFEKTGSWDYGFYACAVLALIAACLAVVLRKMPRPVKEEATSPALAASGSPV
ncbi:MAG: oxalate/formate MFS antiporter [Bryobacteraceae bacterium]